MSVSSSQWYYLKETFSCLYLLHYDINKKISGTCLYLLHYDIIKKHLLHFCPHFTTLLLKRKFVHTRFSMIFLTRLLLNICTHFTVILLKTSLTCLYLLNDDIIKRTFGACLYPLHYCSITKTAGTCLYSVQWY